VDLEVTPGVVIPASELRWKFSRSSGPGGQHVNTSDSRVQLTWVVAESSALSEEQRMRIVHRLTRSHGSGVVTVTVSEQRSQVRNRQIAREALRRIVAAALAPAPALRRATRPTPGSERRRSVSKQQRSATKQQRRRPTSE
jgi:ribosome-associated protein